MTQAPTRSESTAFFIGWVVVGAAVASGLLLAFTIGPILMLGAVMLGAMLRMRSTKFGPSAAGVIVGLGLMPLFIAYSNRSGQGMRCRSTAHSSVCEQQWSPWPWLAIGTACVLLGLGLFVRRRGARMASSVAARGSNSQSRTNPMAVAGLVCSLFNPILGLPLCVIAYRRCVANSQPGGWLALSGICISLAYAAAFGVVVATR